MYGSYWGARRMTTYSPEIQRAQAKVVVDGHILTLLISAIITVSAYLIARVDDGAGTFLTLWFVAAQMAVGARLAIFLYVTRAGIVETRPQAALRWLELGSLASGLVWALLPFAVPHFDGSGDDAAIFLLMIGISAGAIIKGIGCSRISLAFALPVELSIIVALALVGDLTSMVLMVNVIAFAMVLWKSSIGAEDVFVGSERAKLEATALAKSLAEANGDILDSNSRLELLANCDAVTGLANRTHFNLRLQAEITAATESGDRVALLLIDLDRFKTINDTLGHSAGDIVLLEIAERLRATVDADDLIARLGGDEFAVIVAGRDAAERARRTAALLLERGRAPIAVAGTASIVGTSIGLAVYPDQAGSAEDLLSCADLALYEAKEKGRRQLREFDPNLKSQIDRQRIVEHDLEAAIGQGAVEVWFQPQVRLDNGEVCGFEALIRWFHPQLGFVSPPEIIQAAQALHLSERLTTHIASHVCRLLSRLPSLDLPRATVALNVSPREFALYSVADVLERVTAGCGINPALLEVEITEEAILDTDGAGAELKRLETAGYKLAVDDFGMGHSSLAYLISLKIDRLKIDKSFVRNVAESRTNQDLIAALVGLGSALGLDIIVEGVERQQDAAVLQKLGCRAAQGYHFARPMTSAALVDWIAERRAKEIRDKAAVA